MKLLVLASLKVFVYEGEAFDWISCTTPEDRASWLVTSKHAGDVLFALGPIDGKHALLKKQTCSLYQSRSRTF